MWTVVQRWHRRDGNAGTRGGVVVLEPDVFYPTWDPMQASSLRARCGRWSSPGSVIGAGGGAGGHAGGHAGGRLGRLRRSTCDRLHRQGFRPRIAAEAYTNHLWTHTWIEGAQKVNMRDLVALDVRAAGTTHGTTGRWRDAHGKKKAGVSVTRPMPVRAGPCPWMRDDPRTIICEFRGIEGKM